MPTYELKIELLSVALRFAHRKAFKNSKIQRNISIYFFKHDFSSTNLNCKLAFWNALTNIITGKDKDYIFDIFLYNTDKNIIDIYISIVLSYVMKKAY